MTRVCRWQLMLAIDGSVSRGRARLPRRELPFYPVSCWCVICCVLLCHFILFCWAEELDKSSFGWDQCRGSSFFAAYCFHRIDFFGDVLTESTYRRCFVYGVVGHRYMYAPNRFHSFVCYHPIQYRTLHHCRLKGENVSALKARAGGQSRECPRPSTLGISP